MRVHHLLNRDHWSRLYRIGRGVTFAHTHGIEEDGSFSPISIIRPVFRRVGLFGRLGHLFRRGDFFLPLGKGLRRDPLVPPRQAERQPEAKFRQLGKDAEPSPTRPVTTTFPAPLADAI